MAFLEPADHIFIFSSSYFQLDSRLLYEELFHVDVLPSCFYVIYVFLLLCQGTRYLSFVINFSQLRGRYLIFCHNLYICSSDYRVSSLS